MGTRYGRKFHILMIRLTMLMAARRVARETLVRSSAHGLLIEAIRNGAQSILAVVYVRCVNCLFGAFLVHERGHSERSGRKDRSALEMTSSGDWLPRALRLGLTLSSALLLTIAQPPIGLGFVATFSLAPWLIASRRAERAEALGLGLLFGLAYGLAACPWLPNAFASQGSDGWRSVLGAILTVLWAKGIMYGLTGGLAHALRRRSAVVEVVVLAAFFGLAQLWACTSRWGLPVVLLGHSQLALPGVAQLAVVGGAPLVSTLLFATNVGLARAVEDRRGGVPIAAACLAAWPAWAVFGLPLAQSLRPESSVGSRTLLLVQPAVDREIRWKPAFQRVILDDVARQTAAALAKTRIRPDAILWPENLLTKPLARDPTLREQLDLSVDGWDVPVVTGLVRTTTGRESRRYRSSIVWWEPGAGEIASIDKVQAMPLVESSRNFPGRRLLAWLVGGAAGGPLADEAENAGPLTGTFTLTPALCFEVLFPRVVSARRSLDSVAIVNLADDSWVAGEVADAQLVAAAAFRAIEQRMTLVRVAHGGLSVVVDAYGRERMRLPVDVPAHALVHVVSTAPATVLERGSILALGVLPGVIVYLIGRWTLRA